MTNQPRGDKFATQILASGWGADQDQTPGNPEVVPFWLYSHGYHCGSRLMAQLQKDLYDNGIPREELAGLPADPGTAYKAALQHYERTVDSQKEAQHQRLIAVMFNYTRSSKLWEVLPNHKYAHGNHIVLLDWFTRSNVHVLVQTAVLQPTPLTPEQVAAAGKLAMDNHLAKFPNDVPRPRTAQN